MKESQLVVIHRVLNGINSFSIPLDLEFTPDKVVVREVVYSGGGIDGTHVITAPWIRSKENILLAFDDAVHYSSNPNSVFTIKNSATILNGDSSFTIKKATDSLITSTATGRIAITLEFQKFINPRPIDEVIISSTTKMIEAMTRRDCEYPFCLPTITGSGSGEMDPSTRPIPDVHREPEAQAQPTEAEAEAEATEK